MSVEIKVPALGESVVEATVLRWVKKAGEAVDAGEVVAELETDKVNVEVPSEVSGLLEKIVKGEGENVGIGDVLAVVNENASAPKAADNGAQATVALSTAAAPAAVSEPVAHASPVARKLAEERSIDLSAVKGTGPAGKITKQDVEAAASPKVVERVPAAPPAPPLEFQRPSTSTSTSTTPAPVSVPQPPAPISQPPPSDREERRRMSRRRQTIAARLVEAQHTAAMLTTFNEIDMSAVMEIRKRQKDSFKERFGVGLGFMSFFTKAVIGGLKAFPLLNAEIQGDEVVVKHYYDIGIAVSTDEGLVVPVVRDADKLTFAEIEGEIAGLASRSREGKLTLPELQGGTFTITNGGVFGSLMATPILNTPQVGILGMHKIEERPVVKDGQIVIRPMMYVALSYDHRIVDGAESVQFLVRVKQLVEDPTLLMLEG